MCKCGLNHRGWEGHLCRIELAKQAATQVPTLLKKPVLSVPSASVLVKKAKSKPVSANVSANTVKGTKAGNTNAARQAALKSRRTAAGVLILKIWAHVDDHAAIKKYAKELDGNRG